MNSVSLRYNDLDLPNYVNTREVFAGLNVSDLAKAAVLGGLNFMLIGDTGTGKSQLASDIYKYYFGGNKSDGGNGVFIRAHPEVDIYNEIFTELNIERARREMTNSLDSMVFFVDELNRAPPVAQNQFFGLGDGKMDYKGKEIQLGKDDYHLLIATANIGNGEFAGTFETDKALLNRLHVALDLEYGQFKPTYEDLQKIKERIANPNVISAPVRDISDRILEANKTIEMQTTNHDIETLAVLNYLEHGLNNCQRYNLEGKDRVWPMACQDCPHNQNGNSLCSLIKSPTTRTMEVIRKYAVALKYLALLKDPNIKLSPHELVFKSFELSGAYQHLLNPSSLRENFNHNQKLMAEIVGQLQEDYTSVRDYILASLEMVKDGEKATRFYSDHFAGGNIGLYDELNEKVKKSGNVPLIEPYTNQREVGLKWMNEFLEYQINHNKNRSN